MATYDPYCQVHGYTPCKCARPDNTMDWKPYNPEDQGRLPTYKPVQQELKYYPETIYRPHSRWSRVLMFAEEEIETRGIPERIYHSTSTSTAYVMKLSKADYLSTTNHWN
jgi:hypothetical protein